LFKRIRKASQKPLSILVAIVGICAIVFIPAALLVYTVNEVYSIDTLRHNIGAKRHPITKEQILDSLDFSIPKDIADEVRAKRILDKDIEKYDEESKRYLDSLFNNLSRGDYTSGLSLYRHSIQEGFSDSLQTIIFGKTLNLAEGKYSTIDPVLDHYYQKRDYEKVMKCLEMAESWKWDRNIVSETPKDPRAYQRNKVMENGLSYAILILEEKYDPVPDSIAILIQDYCRKGIRLHSNYSVFYDRLAGYAYRFNDPKADKYADIFLKRIKGWDSPFDDDYEYSLDDRGGKAEGYEERFFTDPLFLRYKSCLRKRQYGKARHILELVSSITTDDYQNPFDPYYDFHETINYKNRQYLNTILPYSKYDLASISENARLRHLTHKKDFDEWAIGTYLTGALYLSPTEGYLGRVSDYLFDEGVIKTSDLSAYMTVGYAVDDPRWVYNTALFLKGSTANFSGAIGRAIWETGDSTLIHNVNGRIREHVFSSTRNTDENRYKAINDSIENSIGKNLKAVLSECFYGFTDIRDALSENECAIEIVKVPSLEFNDDVYKAVILKHGWNEPRLVTLGKSSAISKEFIKGNHYSTSSKMHSLIWKPLEKWIFHGETIYYSPDGILSLVNIEAVNNTEGRRLSDIYDIRQCVSTKKVIDDKSNQAYKSIALFGGINYDEEQINASRTGKQAYRGPENPHKDNTFEFLEGTEQEVIRIDDWANKQDMSSRLFIKRDGNEYNFKNLTGNKIDILHIATHGFYYNAQSTKGLDFFEMITFEDNPLNRCGLIMSGGNKAWKGENVDANSEDGILLGSEIARMDLTNTDLVVLSACNTGLGDIEDEGVAGLQMAFKQAGVNSILMTLGKVDDEATAFFMNAFYEKLFSGSDKQASYKYAISSMRNSEKFKDPKYWANFVLIN